MPYIKQADRIKIEDIVIKGDLNNIERIVNRIETEGDLNYTITKLCHLYIKKFDKKYATLNTVIGVLECAKLELYRKIISKYENGKEAENGRV